MKTTIAKISFIVLAFLAVSSSFTSCKKENAKPSVEEEAQQNQDVRAQALGTYDYTIEFYTIGANNTLSYIGKEYDEQGVIQVEAEQGTTKSLVVMENNETIFRGVGITENGVGFNFSIPGQQFQDGDTQITMNGFPYWEMNGEKHDGLFRTDSNEFRAAIEATVDGVSVVMLMRAFKQ